MKPPTPYQAGPARPDDAAPGLARKSVELELKELADDGSFTMYAAAFNNVDRGGDIIVPGAFTNLDEFVRDGWIALNHRAADPAIGYPTAATQDARGLRVEGQFHSHAEAQAVRTIVKERLAAGKSVKASIGYLIDESTYEQRGDKQVRKLAKVRVYETSIVNLPMNPEADVVSAKSQSHPPEGPVPASQTDHAGDSGALAALKRLLGLGTKSGAAISKANREKLHGVADAMEEHHTKGMEHCKGLYKACKSLMAHHEEGTKIAESLRDFADSHEPDVDDEDEPPAKKPRKGRKEEDPEDTADGNPPKGLSREQIAVRLATLNRPA